MKQWSKKIVIAGVLVLIAIVQSVAQNHTVVAINSQNRYYIQRNPEISSYQWKVYLDRDLTTEATSQEVILGSAGVNREHEVDVQWKQAGNYFLAVHVVGADNCDNTMAFPFMVIDRLTANTDYLLVYSGQQASVNLLQNDIYTLPLDIMLIDFPVKSVAVNNSSFNLQSNGTLIYDADPDFIGQDSLCYVITNELGADTSTIYITIDPFVNLTLLTSCADEKPFYSWQVDVVGTTIDQISLTLENMANEIVELHSNVPLSGQNQWPGITETGAYPIWNIPPENASLTVTLDYEFELGQRTQTHTLDAPNCHINRVFANWDSFTVYGYTPLEILANDVDPDGDNIDPQSVELYTDPDNLGPYFGRVSINPDGTINYMPDAGYSGRDSFIYRVCDTNPDVACDTAIVKIDVKWSGRIVANTDYYYLYTNYPKDLHITENDYAQQNGIDYSETDILTLPQHGTATMLSAGVVNYVPDTNYRGLDSFEYRICTIDEPIACDNAWAVLHIGDNQCVVAQKIDTFTAVQNTLDIDLALYVSDFENEIDTRSVEIVEQPANGRAFSSPGFVISYTPGNLYAGPDSFVYRVCDAGEPQCCTTSTVYVDVRDMNEPVVALPDYGITEYETQTIVEVLANDYDPDGEIDLQSFEITRLPLNGMVVLNADNTISYIPNNEFDGDDTFEYIVCDNGPIVSCDTALVTITVEPDKTVRAIDDYVTLGIDQVVNFDVLANDLGEFERTSLYMVTEPERGYANIESDWTVTYRPDFEYTGLDSFIYHVCDANLVCDSARVTLSVIDIIDPPQLFTPNNDGDNDEYIIRGLEKYPDNTFIVYNRWGNVVYKKDAYYDQWGGYSNVSGAIGQKELPVGVYYYILRYDGGKEKAGALFLER